MRIAYLMQTGAADLRQRPLSGPAHHARQVLDGLRRRGHQVALLAVYDGHILRSDDLEHFRPVGTALDRAPWRNVESVLRRGQRALRLPYLALFDALRFALACRRELAAYDVLYERMGWMGYGGALAARLMRVPRVLEVNGDHISEIAALGIAPAGMQQHICHALLRSTARTANHVVATGEGWRQRFLARWRTPPDTVTTVENGSELVELCARPRLRCFAAAPPPGAAVTIAFLGAFDPWQGVDVLLRAFAAAASHTASARLVLIGDGRDAARLRALCTELGVGERVRFAGHLPLPEAARHLESADIGVSPYCGRANFTGLKLLDYKAAGLAIIAAGENGQPDLIEHGRSGWIVPPCDVGALRDALVELCTDTTLRARLGRAAREDAERRHGWQHTVAAIEAVLESVVATHRGGFNRASRQPPRQRAALH